MPYSPRKDSITHTKSMPSLSQPYEYQHHGTDYDASMNVVDDYEYHPTEDYDAIVRKTKKSSSSRREFENYDSSYSPTLSYSSVSSGRSSTSGRKKDVLEELSEEDMRRKMYKKYKDKGVIGLLKTQLRSVIYDDLTKKAPMKEPNITVFGSRSEIQRACDGIILDHLKKNGYSFTTSIFTSEANIKEVPKNSEYDVYHLIGVKIYNLDVIKDTDSHELLDYDPNNQLTKLLSEMYYSTNWKGESILTKFLSVIKKLGDKKTRVGMCQTDPLTEDQPVDSKLKMIDEEFITQLENDKKTQTQSMEQKYLEYQRECEKRANEELKSRLKMFEETTISAMRLEESAKYRERIARELEEMEKSHMRKMERLMEREREISARLEKKEKDLEKQLFEHRQKMYKEVEDLQRRNQALLREKNNLEMKKTELEEKAKRLDVVTAQTSVDIKSEMSLMRANLERENMANMRRIEEERRKLELEKEQLAEQLRKHSESKEKLVDAKSEMAVMRANLESLERENIANMRRLDEERRKLELEKEQVAELKLKKLGESNSNNEKSVSPPAIIHIPSIDPIRENSLNREIENLKLQLRDKEREFSNLQDKILAYERNERTLRSTIEGNDREKIRIVDDFKKELIEERQKAKKAFIQWQATEKSVLLEKFQKERVRMERMQRDLEEQYLQNRSLQHEIDRLRTLLELPRVSGGELKKTNYSDIGYEASIPEISYPKSLFLDDFDKAGYSFGKDFGDLKDVNHSPPRTDQSSTKEKTNDIFNSLNIGSFSNLYMMEDTKPSSYSSYGLSNSDPRQMTYSTSGSNNLFNRGGESNKPINLTANDYQSNVPTTSSTMGTSRFDTIQPTSSNNYPSTITGQSYNYTQPPTRSPTKTSPPKKTFDEILTKTTLNPISPKKYQDTHSTVTTSFTQPENRQPQQYESSSSFIPSPVIGSTSPNIISTSNPPPSIEVSTPSTFSNPSVFNTSNKNNYESIEKREEKQPEPIYQKPPSPKKPIIEQPTFKEQQQSFNTNTQVREEKVESPPRPTIKEEPPKIKEEPIVVPVVEQKPSSIEEYKRLLQQQRESDSRASTRTTYTSSSTHDSEPAVVDEQATEEEEHNQEEYHHHDDSYHHDDHLNIHDKDHHSDGWNISDASISGGGFDDDDFGVEDDLFGQKDYDDF